MCIRGGNTATSRTAALAIAVVLQIEIWISAGVPECDYLNTLGFGLLYGITKGIGRGGTVLIPPFRG